MTITEDILALEQNQKDLKKDKGRYVQAIATPEIIPKKNDKTTFTKLKKPDYESIEIEFTPKTKDYQFTVHVWESDSSDGFHIVAKRDLGDGIIEHVYKSIGDEVKTITDPQDSI